MLHYVCHPTYDEIQSQLHSFFKCIGLCIIYLTSVVPQTAGLLSSSRLQDRTCQFCNFTRGSPRNSTGLKCKTQMTSSVPPRYPILWQFLSTGQNTPLKVGLMTYLHQASSVGSYHFSFAIIVLDAAVQTQHITNHIVKVPVILMVQSSLLVLKHFLVFGQNRSQHR